MKLDWGLGYFEKVHERTMRVKVSTVPLQAERRFSGPVHLESGCESS